MVRLAAGSVCHPICYFTLRREPTEKEVGMPKQVHQTVKRVAIIGWAVMSIALSMVYVYRSIIAL